VGIEHAEKAISLPTMWERASIFKVDGKGEGNIHPIHRRQYMAKFYRQPLAFSKALDMMPKVAFNVI
jgi:hypothetical protein